MSGLILHLSILQSHVFLLNSRLDLFTAAHLEDGRPFSRSYGAILPSSLAINHSSTLEFSSQLPVSVWGTGCFTCFSWKSLFWIITSTEVSVYYRRVTTGFNVLFRQYAPNLRLRHFYCEQVQKY